MNVAKINFTTPNQNCAPNKSCPNCACKMQQPSFGNETSSFSTTIGKGLKALWKLFVKGLNNYGKSCCGNH